MKLGIYYHPYTLEMIEILGSSIFSGYRVMNNYVINECGSYQGITALSKEELKNFRYLGDV